MLGIRWLVAAYAISVNVVFVYLLNSTAYITIIFSLLVLATSSSRSKFTITTILLLTNNLKLYIV